MLNIGMTEIIILFFVFYFIFSRINRSRQPRKKDDILKKSKKTSQLEDELFG